LVKKLNITEEKYDQFGVTLVELLLALFILGLSVSVVVLNTPQAGQNTKREAERFAARLNAASDEAILSSQSIGLMIMPTGYKFSRYNDGEWIDIESKILGEWKLDSEISMNVTKQDTDRTSFAMRLTENDKILARQGSFFAPSPDKASTVIPEFQFHPIGEDIPLIAQFSGYEQHWVVQLSANGQLSVRCGQDG